jgi:hypothetical protein
MDAATLYIMLTMQDGSRTASARGYPSLRACADGMEFMKEVARSDRDGPILGYWCVENRQTVSLSTCSRHYRGPCEYFDMSTLRGCAALRWVKQMRDWSLFGHCYVGDRRETDEGPQPDPYDGKVP